MGGAATALNDGAMRPARLRVSGWMIGWLLATALLVVAFGGEAMRLDFSEPDNTMRLVQVRDLLAGQGWFDNVQHRLNPPAGVASHWARWIDAAIAAPIAALTPLVGQARAEVVAAFAWPLGLLGVFMWLVSRVSREVAGEALGREASVIGPVLAALATPTMEKFAPGAFDHHNVELIFAFAAMLGLMRMARAPRMGALAGAALGAALATAAEGLPQVAAGVAAAGLLWLLRPADCRRGFVWFGLGLAASTVLFFVMLTPLERWGLRVTDAMSPAFLMIGLVSGALAMMLGAGAWGERASMSVRVSAAAGAAATGLVLLLAVAPELLNGGYATLSPEMKTLWLPQISETRSLAEVWRDNPGQALGLAGSAAAGLIAAAMMLRSRRKAANAWIALAFLAAGWGVLAWQIRGAELATAFALPFGAWACATARAAMAQQRPRALLAFAAVCAVSTSALWNAAGAQVLARSASAGTLADYAARNVSSRACLSREAVVPLAAASPGVILNPFALGPQLLAWTPHSVLAAPYHRDGGGITLMMDAMRSSADDARALLADTNADYILVCAGLPEMRWYASHPTRGGRAEATLSARLARGDTPDWLREVKLEDTPVRLYRILR